MPDTPLFKQALSRFLSGVTVVSARHEEVLHGMTASAFCSVSLDPPMVLVCIDLAAELLPAIRGSGAFGVSVLSDAQQDLSVHFSGGTPAAPVWTPLGRSTVVDGSVAQLDCAVDHLVEAGDHAVVIGRVEAARVKEGQPLGYWRGGYRRVRQIQVPGTRGRTWSSE